MHNSRRQRRAFALAVALAAVSPVGLGAQGVALGSGLTIFDGADPVVTIDHGATHQAGGQGRDASLFLKNRLGEIVLAFVPSDLTIGGGTLGEDGDLRLLDTTQATSIDFDGRLGLLTLGAVGEDGDIYVHDAGGTRTFQVDGATGNVTNAPGGNGLVKAWAHIDGFSGDVLSCWRCSPENAKVADGVLRVRFPALGDVRGRPRIATVFDNGTSYPNFNYDVPLIRTRDSTQFADAVVIETYEPNDSSPTGWFYFVVAVF